MRGCEGGDERRGVAGAAHGDLRLPRRGRRREEGGGHHGLGMARRRGDGAPEASAPRAAPRRPPRGGAAAAARRCIGRAPLLPLRRHQSEGYQRAGWCFHSSTLLMGCSLSIREDLLNNYAEQMLNYCTAASNSTLNDAFSLYLANEKEQQILQLENKLDFVCSQLSD